MSCIEKPTSSDPEVTTLLFVPVDPTLDPFAIRILALMLSAPQAPAELRSELQTEFRTGLHGLRADLLRWMFGFWATTLLTLAGLIIAR